MLSSHGGCLVIESTIKSNKDDLHIEVENNMSGYDRFPPMTEPGEGRCNSTDIEKGKFVLFI